MADFLSWSNPLIRFLFCLLCLCPLAAQDEDLLPEHFESYSFSVIRIPVWVTNSRGLPVANLTKNHFRLKVDGRRVPIENFLQTYDAPMELVYLLDVSGSMEFSGKLKGSIEAINRLLAGHRVNDRWKIVVFSDGQIVPAASSEDPGSWERVRGKLEGYGKTALFDTLGIADRFFDVGSLNSRAVCVFTDGWDNHSILDEDHLLRVLKVLQVPVFIVALGNGFTPQKMKDHAKLGLQTLTNIATITGGTMLFAEDVGQLGSIGTALSKALRPQYMLTMTVEHKGDGERHDIGVSLVRKRSYTLRYRQGYLGSVPNHLGGH